MAKAAYRHKYKAASNPVKWALMAADHRAQLEETQIAQLLALQSLEAGIFTDTDMQRIAFMIRMAQELAKDGIGLELIPMCQQAIAGDLNCQLLRELFEYHKLQCEAATPAQYLRAMGRL